MRGKFRMSKNLYDVVGDKIIDYCNKTYYSDIIISFEQSYDGKEWTKEVEFASFENGVDLYYEHDWNEGQTYLRNLLIWHLDESVPVKHGRWKKFIHSNNNITHYCSECKAVFYKGCADQGEYNFCPNCGAKMDLNDVKKGDKDE